MNDSQEITIENFYSDLTQTIYDSGMLGVHGEVNLKQVNLDKDMSIPSPSGKYNLKNKIKRRSTIIEVKRSSRVEHIQGTPERLSDKICRGSCSSHLEYCMPNQSVNSPESIETPEPSSTHHMKSIDHRSIYLYDLKDRQEQSYMGSVLNIDEIKDDLCEDSLEVPSMPLCDRTHLLMKKNLSSIFELTEDGSSKENIKKSNTHYVDISITQKADSMEDYIKNLPRVHKNIGIWDKVSRFNQFGS